MQTSSNLSHRYRDQQLLTIPAMETQGGIIMGYQYFNADIRDLWRFTQKRGTGKGPYYTPWFRRQDGPNNTKKFETYSPKLRRACVSLGTLEKQHLDSILFLLHLDNWGKYKVIDYREQWPLWPHEKTQEIAKALGLRHPLHPRDRKGPGYKKFPTVMTADCILTVKEGNKTFDIAITIKPQKRLNKHTPKTEKFSDIENFEIQRKFFESENTPFYIVTEDEISTEFAYNAKFLNPFYDPARLSNCDINDVSNVLDFIKPKLEAGEIFRYVSRQADEAFGYTGEHLGTSLRLIYHLITIDAIRINMFDRLDTNKPLPILHIEPDNIASSPLMDNDMRVE